MSGWTDELKAQVVEEYVAAEPTPENTMDIIGELAEKHNKTVNGIRNILSKAEVYVKKVSGTASSGSSEKKTSTRVSKADAIASLREIMEANALEVDDSIVDKLTGKAAVYFTNVIRAALPDEE